VGVTAASAMAAIAALQDGAEAKRLEVWPVAEQAGMDAVELKQVQQRLLVTGSMVIWRSANWKPGGHFSSFSMDTAPSINIVVLCSSLSDTRRDE